MKTLSRSVLSGLGYQDREVAVARSGSAPRADRTAARQGASFQARALGQVGYRFQFGQIVVYVDPYLSDYVERVEGAELRRLFPVPFAPDTVRDCDWVLITHAHIDHCDPMTLAPIAAASPRCRFVGPEPVLAALRQQGIAEERLQPAQETQWLYLGGALKVIAVPAAHPSVSRGGDGCAQCVGYVIEYSGRRIYHAGDTSVADELLVSLQKLTPIEIAFLPVNERNFFRERKGIIGNMTIREAFGLADEIGIKTVVPVHWDMFAPNCVPREEIELAYKLLRPAFTMKIYPEEL